MNVRLRSSTHTEIMLISGVQGRSLLFCNAPHQEYTGVQCYLHSVDSSVDTRVQCYTKI